MNAGKSQRVFVDSNIWLYRFIVNESEKNAIPKQQIATSITNQENLLISTQVVNEVCSNLIRKAGFDNSQMISLVSWAFGVAIGSAIGALLYQFTQMFLGEVIGLALTWLVVAIITGVSAHKIL